MAKTFLLSIGVGKFSGNDYPRLDYAPNDASAFFKLFTSIHDIESENSCLLINESADYKSVHSALYSIFSQLPSPADTVIFYFSGHNVVINDIHAAFLVLYTSRGKYPGINLRELRTLIEECPSKKVLVFIDSCYSGSIGQDIHSISANGFTVNVSNLAFDSPSSSTKLIFAASPSSRTVKESKEYQYSFFTYELLAIVSECIESGKTITASTLFDMLSYNLEIKLQPIPVRYGIEHGRTIIADSSVEITRSNEKECNCSHIPLWLDSQVRELNCRYPIEGDKVEFINDVNYPDGSVLKIGEKIIKTWAIKNAGKISWKNRNLKCIGITRGTGIIQVPPMVPVPETNPGEIVNISIPMIMPVYAATVHQLFKMVDACGEICFPDKKGVYVTFNVIE